MIFSKEEKKLVSFLICGTFSKYSDHWPALFSSVHYGSPPPSKQVPLEHTVFAFGLLVSLLFPAWPRLQDGISAS